MVDAVEKAGFGDDTVIALVGDHGWQLGEHNIWGKHTNFELGARVPLLIKDPSGKGGRTAALVESVDIYPTVAALAGLPPPPDLDGTSYSSLLMRFILQFIKGGCIHAKVAAGDDLHTHTHTHTHTHISLCLNTVGNW